MSRLKTILSVFLIILAFVFYGSGDRSLAQSQTNNAQSQPQSITVHITKTGKKYHRTGCRYLSNSDIPIDLAKAKAEGYTPCSVCKPPQ